MRKHKHYTNAELTKFHNAIILLALADLITDGEKEKIKQRLFRVSNRITYEANSHGDMNEILEIYTKLNLIK